MKCLYSDEAFEGFISSEQFVLRFITDKADISGIKQMFSKDKNSRELSSNQIEKTNIDDE